MNVQFQPIIDAIGELDNAGTAILTVLEDIAARLQALVDAGPVDPADVQAIADAIREEARPLAEAALRHTPAEEPAP